MSIYEEIKVENSAHTIYELRSPVTGEVTGELKCASDEEVQEAVNKARSAQPAWAALSFDARAKIMNRALELVLERQDEIMDTVVKETGKARTEALTMEVLSSCDQLCYYAKNTKKFLKPIKKRIHGVVGLGKKLTIFYVPLGVVGVITPWNGPFVLAVNPSVQALMAGNAVVVKGSEVTPYSTKIAETIFRDAGVPEGVFQVLMGNGKTGAALVESGIDKISFTGSAATGRKVGEACGRNLVPFTLELGGKDAMIVCEDANIERAANGAVIGSCMNTGHYCCGTERIYVADKVYDEFVGKVTEKTEKLRQGSQDFNEDVGAVFWDKQMDIIEDHVKEAKKKGAKVLCGGERNKEFKGMYYKPTVMVDVDHNMKIMQDETFGPILCIMRVKDDAEALKLANDTKYGLNGNVWTSNKAKGIELAKQMETGAVCVNDMAMTYGAPAAPFGGRKSSGLGQVNGELGVRGYCHALPVIVDKSNKDSLMGGYPYSDEKAEGMKKFMNFMWHKTPLGRWLS